MLRLALATARLTRLITEDSITEPVRDRIPARYELLVELVHCRWCAGVWAAGAVLIADRAAPLLVDTLALAQIGCMTMAATERMER